MNSSTGLYIIAVSIITKAEIDRFEYIGHGLFIFGAILMLLDPFAIKVGATDTWILGALIPLFGAGFGSILSFINHKANSLHPIVTMTQFYFFCDISDNILSTIPSIRFILYFWWEIWSFWMVK